MTTIAQVAERAGVSPATASRALNGHTVTPGTAERVRAAAAELAYVPNRAARSLRTRSSEVIALILADIENPFFTSLARGVEDQACQAGYSVVLCNTDNQVDKEGRYIDIALAEHMSGLIIVPASNASDLSPWLGRSLPTVAVDRPVPGGGQDADLVVVDNEAGGRLATGALYAEGRARVACITGPVDVTTAVDRAAGWAEVYAAHHPGEDPSRYLRHADFKAAGGAVAMASLLADSAPPDAVFVANNLMAAGALLSLWERGIAPPATGLASFGDLPYGLLQPTPITVIDLPARQMGRRAAALLLDRIAGRYTGPGRRIIMGGADDTASTPDRP